MSEIDKAREAGWDAAHGSYDSNRDYFDVGFDAGYATATAKIERLEKALKQARLDFAFLSVRNLGKSIADKAVEAIDKALEPKDGEL